MNRSSRFICRSIVSILLLSYQSVYAGSSVCATTVAELRKLLEGYAMHELNWIETSMDDGKPLLVSISEDGGALHLKFVKTGQGLWAQSSGVLCQTDGPSAADFEFRFRREQIQIGPEVHWLLGTLLSNSEKFTLRSLGPGRWRIFAPPWQGTFESVH